MRIAVVTGASSGIGAATVKALDLAGYATVAAARRAERLTELAESGKQVLAVPGDITRDGAVAALFAAAQVRWGRSPDTFVLNAGRGLPGTVLTSDESQWREMFELNVLSAAKQLRDCVAGFRGDPATPPVRDIVVIGSTIGRVVSPFNPVYGATKFALHSLVEGLRQEVCAEGIRVTLLEPGFVRSEFQQSAGYDLDWFNSLEPDSGPFLQPEDVARTIEFVLAQPPHVHLDDIRLRPTRQKV